jgi:UDP-N-acetylglucosamine:LPS N-acetylglucosamine transferase
MRVLLVSSAGGVLLDLLALEPWWSTHDAVWAAVGAADTSALLAGRRVHWIREVSLRQPLSLLPALLKAWRILRVERPALVVSAGAGPAVAFFWAARLLRIPTFWVSTFNVLTTPGIAGRICSALASRVVLQRSASLAVHPGGLVVGELY